MGAHLLMLSFFETKTYPTSLLGRKRVTLVLHTGQVAWAIRRPLGVSLTVPSLIVYFLRHLTLKRTCQHLSVQWIFFTLT